MKIIVSSISALPRGLHYCFREQEIRRLAIRPWIFGTLIYFLTTLGALYVHSWFVHLLVPHAEGFWMSLLYWLTWMGVTLFLVAATAIVSLSLILVFTSVYQTDIARAVLLREGQPAPAAASGIRGAVTETGRTVFIELGKLLWILPLFVMSIFFGFIPFLAPLAFILGAWLLGYQFIDIVLDTHRYTLLQRLSFGIRRCVAITLFGMTLMFAWLIPFVGLLLAPAAVAGAAWFLASTKLVESKREAL